MSQNTKMLVGALIAAALAIAVYYGLIPQQTANSIQTQVNQTLQTQPASQQGAPPMSQNPPAPPVSPAAPPQQTPPPQPVQH